MRRRRFPSQLARLAVILGALAIALAGALGSLAEEGDLPDPDAKGLTLHERFEALITRAGLEQARLRSLRASFVQKKESVLLLTPEESSGTFSFKAPDRVRWDYTAPSDRVLLIRDQEMLTWYRDLGRAERVKVGRQADSILRFLGASSSLEELQRYFTLRASFPKDEEKPYRLELLPRSARIARRVESISIELDRELYIPVYFRYVEAGGDITEFRFAELRLNEEIPDERFEIEFGEDVEVQVLDLGP